LFASVSVLHRHIFDQISENVRPSLNTNCGKLKVADGEMITPAGAAWMTFVIDGKPYSYRMLVADIEVPAVLGYDFLRDNNCEMKLGKGTFKLNGESVNCKLHSQSVAENVVVPPASEMIIPTKVVGVQPVGKTAVITEISPSVSKKGILVGKSVFDPNKNEIPVRVVNVSDSVQTIYKNTVTTECEVVRESDVLSFQNESDNETDTHTLNNLDILKVPQEQELVPDHVKVVLDSCKNDLSEVELAKVCNLL
jgi:hypothetical protein